MNNDIFARRPWWRRPKIILLFIVLLFVVYSTMAYMLNTTRLGIGRTCPIILSRIFQQPVTCRRVESLPFRGFIAYDVQSDAKAEHLLKVAVAEIHFEPWALLLGMRVPREIRLEQPVLDWGSVEDVRKIPWRDLFLNGRHPERVKLQDARIAIHSQSGDSILQINNTDLLLEKEPGEKTLMMMKVFAHNMLPGQTEEQSLRVKLEHQGVLYRNDQQYLAESFRIQLTQGEKSIGSARLDRSVSVAWNPKAPFSQMLPAEVACTVKKAPLRIISDYVALPDALTSGTLSCDVSASISGGGRLLDTAGWLQMDGNYFSDRPPLEFWSEFRVRTDLATRLLHNCSANSRLLEGRLSRGKWKLRTATEPESGDNEGTLSIENMDVPLVMQLASQPDIGIAKATFSTEQAWKWDQQLSRFTIAGEGQLDNISIEKGIKATPPLKLAWQENLLKQEGRLRGGWSHGLGLRIQSFHEAGALDELGVIVNLARNDPGALNQITLMTSQLQMQYYQTAILELVRNIVGSARKIHLPVPQSVPAFAFDVSCDKLLLAEKPLEQVKINGRFARNKVDITSGSLCLGRGTAIFDAIVHLEAAGKPYQANIQAQQMNLPDLGEALNHEVLRSLAGDASWKATVHGLASPAPDPVQWEIKGGIRVLQPQFTSVKALKALYALPGLGTAVSSNARELTLTGKISPGQWSVQQGDLQGQGYRIRFSGSGQGASGEWTCRLGLGSVPAENTAWSAYMLRGLNGFLYFPFDFQVQFKEGGKTRVEIRK